MNERFEIKLIDPAAVDWRQVWRVQVQPYDSSRAMEPTVPGPIRTIPLLGRVRRYAVEIVFIDDTWDRVLWADDAGVATALAHRLSAEHDVPVRPISL